MIKHLSLILLFCISLTNVDAQYYDTLPKGVRLIMNKNIQTKVKSSYNKSKSETPYAYEIEADITNLEKIDNSIVKDILELFKDYPEAYSKLSLGTHKLDAEANIKVNVYGMAYGITNKVSAYIGVPIYDARVKVNYKKTKNSSQEEVAEALQNIYGDNWAQTLGNIVEKVYDIDGGTIQSGITNALGYEELGDWSGQGLGDIEFGAMYNFYRTDNHGLMLTIGGVAPTGYVDDPDILQDIGFGDGQWDAFVEFGGGRVLSNTTSVNLWSRFTYQLASEKTLRVPYSSDVSISDQKGKFTEKLGNKYLLATNVEHYVNDWFKLEPSLSYQFTEASEYSSDNSTANRILAEDSESSVTNLKILGQLTSVKLYQQKKFILPGLINLSYQTSLGGLNTPKADLYEVEFRMYF